MSGAQANAGPPSSIVTTDEDGEQITLRLSPECDAQAAALLTDPNFITLRQQSAQYCRLKTQNALAGCCNDFSYELGQFYNCQANCVSDCTLSGVADLCSFYGGRSCTAKFRPVSGNPAVFVPVNVTESVCIPDECDNDNDKSILFQLPVGNAKANPLNPQLYYYPTHMNVAIECDSATGSVILILVATFFAMILLGFLSVYLFRPPRRRNTKHARDKALKSFFGEDVGKQDPVQMAMAANAAEGQDDGARALQNEDAAQESKQRNAQSHQVGAIEDKPKVAAIPM